MKASSFRKLKAALLCSLVVAVGYTVGGPAVAAQKKQQGANQAQATPSKKESSTSGIDPKDPSSVIYLDSAGRPAGTGDPGKPASVAYKAGMGWHPQAISASGLPKDRYGLVDWARLVRENIISPKASLDPEEEEIPPLKMDVVITAKGDFVNDVIYPHEMHTYWLKCDVCHPQIFVPAKGSNEMTMVGIVQGEWCGRCHGKVAFPLTDCNRCHSTPKKAASK
ncbi:MAG: hypothetical protein A2V21_309275 [Deltaproteobacteria bacterium GWC2_55_46]|nr:MAG: hypothetical protein A2Z79_03375 [Deltaproteobacteria bacterium GWA2_55_82]OGQ62321.1 MAG: hypothetical protein A3I81_05285 [Deltaproteobacteria bacterium RIFCSPLOWO2_02_FULL_55_12]OIJ74433.1 MAG: hypothetical protein A2V21_309275 [Deltaproteobacteria bacterium GWC2_55_46]